MFDRITGDNKWKYCDTCLEASPENENALSTPDAVAETAALGITLATTGCVCYCPIWDPAQNKISKTGCVSSSSLSAYQYVMCAFYPACAPVNITDKLATAIEYTHPEAELRIGARLTLTCPMNGDPVTAICSWDEVNDIPYWDWSDKVINDCGKPYAPGKFDDLPIKVHHGKMGASKYGNLSESLGTNRSFLECAQDCLYTTHCWGVNLKGGGGAGRGDCWTIGQPVDASLTADASSPEDVFGEFQFSGI